MKDSILDRLIGKGHSQSVIVMLGVICVLMMAMLWASLAYHLKADSDRGEISISAGLMMKSMHDNTCYRDNVKLLYRQQGELLVITPEMHNELAEQCNSQLGKQKKTS